MEKFTIHYIINMDWALFEEHTLAGNGGRLGIKKTAFLYWVSCARKLRQLKVTEHREMLLEFIFRTLP